MRTTFLQEGFYFLFLSVIDLACSFFILVLNNPFCLLRTLIHRNQNTRLILSS